MANPRRRADVTGAWNHAAVTISVASRRRGAAGIAREFPGASVVDVTSKGPQPWVRLSPFYPHGGIPVPLSPDGVVSESVEGIWQALKVFDTADVDLSKLRITAMKGLKRTVRRFGTVQGHRAGTNGGELLSYQDARRRIYLPAYRWMLIHRAADVVRRLRKLAEAGDVVLLDYTTNGDPTDPGTPLSHAALVKHHLDNTWPSEE